MGIENALLLSFTAEKGENPKSFYFPIEFKSFLVSGGPKLEQKSIKNRSKHDLNMGRHLGIDFLTIFVDFGTQVGSQNGAGIDCQL